MIDPKAAAGAQKPGMFAVPPEVLTEIGAAMEEGARKYGLFNWRGTEVRVSTYYNAAMRHLLAFRSGEDTDGDSNLPHVVKAITSLIVLRDAQTHGQPFIDDRGAPSCFSLPRPIARGSTAAEAESANRGYRDCSCCDCDAVCENYPPAGSTCTKAHAEMQEKARAADRRAFEAERMRSKQASEVDRLRKQLTVLESNIVEVREHAERLGRLRRAFEETCHEQAKQLGEAQELRAKLNCMLSDQTRELNVVRESASYRESVRLHARVKELEGQLQHAHVCLGDRDAKIARQESRDKAIVAENTQLRNGARAAQQRLVDRDWQIERLKALDAESLGNLKAIREAHDKLLTEVEDWKQRADTATRERDGLHGANALTRHQLNEMGALTQERDRLVRLCRELHQWLAFFPSSGLEGTYGAAAVCTFHKRLADALKNHPAT